MVAKTSLAARLSQIREECDTHGYSFVHVIGEFEGAKTRIAIKCHVHGEWNTSINNFVNNHRGCRSCKGYKVLQEEPAIREAISELKESGIIFERIVGDFVGVRTELAVRCAEHPHVEWVCKLGNIRSGNGSRPGIKGCRLCYGDHLSGNILRDFSKYEQRVLGICSAKNLRYVGRFGPYCGASTLLEFSCDEHGPWYATITRIQSNRRVGCPGCISCGFDQTKPGFLYALVSDCGTRIKVGISNYPDRRLNRLNSRTPFGFKVAELVAFAEGFHARQLEVSIHREFESANLSGFDGATEWLKFDGEILNCIRRYLPPDAM